MKKSTTNSRSNSKKTKTSNKKSVAKSSARRSLKSRLSTSSLRAVKLLSAALLAVQAAALVLLADKQKGDEPLIINYLARDPIASDAAGQTVMASASDHILTVNLLYILLAALLSAAIFNLLLSTRYRQAYDAAVVKGANPLKFLNLAFSLSALSLAIALVAGIRDIASLLIIVFTVVVACLLGARTELARMTNQAAVSRLSAVIAAVPVVLAGLYVFAAHVYGGGLPFERLIPLGVAAVLLLAGALVLNASYRNNRSLREFSRVENAYSIMTFLLLSGVSWAIFATLLK